jgi:hypothetical protein
MVSAGLQRLRLGVFFSPVELLRLLVLALPRPFSLCAAPALLLALAPLLAAAVRLMPLAEDFELRDAIDSS